MPKLTLTDLVNLQNESTAVAAINNNSTAIENAIENTLSRDGTSPNTMSASLDMNSNRILNLPAPVSDNEPARKVDIASGGSGTIADNAVTDAKLRDSGPLSVIGRSANSSGDPADISASAASGAVLRESGSVLGFGTIATAGIADDAVTYAKIQNVSATDKVLGRSTSGAGDVEEIACTAAARALLDDADAAAQRTTLGGGDTIALLAASQTLTNKSIDLTNNTLVGSVTEFNTALESADFATFAASQVDNCIARADGTGALLQTTGIRIDDFDRMLIGGHTTSVQVGGNDLPVQVFGTSGSTTAMAYGRFSNDTFSPSFRFAKSRAGSIGGFTVVQSGDNLGQFQWCGADGSDLTSVAGTIQCVVDGTPGNNDMPGRLELNTTSDGAVSSTNRMLIDSKGNVVVNTAAIATTATDGFLYVPTCAGTPTGTPTTYAGRAPIVVDTTNNKLYFYSTGAWRDAGP